MSHKTYYKIANTDLENSTCESQLIITTEELQRSIDQKKQIPVSRCKSLFKSFRHRGAQQTNLKLQNYGIQGKNNKWINKWVKFRNQKVVLDGEMSDPVPVTPGVPHGKVLSPLMFLLYINDINQNINSKIRLFADDCVLYREINPKLDCLEVQQDLQKLVYWSHTWQMSFNINKSHTLYAQRKKQPIIHNGQHSGNTSYAPPISWHRTMYSQTSDGQHTSRRQPTKHKDTKHVETKHQTSLHNCKITGIQNNSQTST